MIDKPGSSEKRPLGIPTVRDRIAQSAMLHILEPIFERDFYTRSQPLPQCLARCSRADLSASDHPRRSRKPCTMKRLDVSCRYSPTGEPDAGNPPVRFGGRVAQPNAPSLPL